MPGPRTRSRAVSAALAAALALAALLAWAGGAGAKSFIPHHHKIFHGVSDTTDNGDFRHFRRQVGAHPATLEDFYHWDTPLTTGALKRWHQTRTRGVLSLSTAPGVGPEIISPRAISNGRDDHYLVRLNQSISVSKQVVYIRLFPEMNGHWNPYCAFRADGSRKSKSHSTGNFRRAWQRAVIIIRGGKVKTINRALRRRHMPRLLRGGSNHDPVYLRENIHHRLAHPKVAFMWTPQTFGSPNMAGNQPANYWPGRKFVDWVGADIYSKFATRGVWSAFHRFYRKYRHLPFVVGEYSPWDNDSRGRFTKKLFHWAERHGRVRMLIYYRSVFAGSPYDIGHFPGAKRVLRHELNKKRFAQYAVSRHRHHGHHRHRRR